MICRSYILNNIKELDRMYNSSRSQKKRLFYSKLALLELCGWIEESMDEIVIKSSHRCLRDTGNRNYIADEIVRRIYGFEYAKHFRKMLTQVIGFRNLEMIENRITIHILTNFKATLERLTIARNKEAHTHIKGTTRLINAPSISRNDFNYIFDGLKKYETLMRRNRL